MRDNSPVTQKEFVIPEGYVLVSETDLHGNITFANDAFVEVSGYTHEELIGQPHNLIRHPDVPPRVFEDLWQTISKGESWHQYVKNRRKNGDHYWVEANIAPVIKNGQITGYKSIRNPIKRELIPSVEAAYKKLAAGELLINSGTVTTPMAARLQRWSPLPQKSVMKKTMIPLVVMAIIWSIVLQIYLQHVADTMFEESVQERQELLINNLNAEISSASRIAVTNALGIAGNSTVIYGLYDKQKTVIWQILEVNYQQYIKRSSLENIGIAVFDENLQKVSNSGVNIEVSTMPKDIYAPIIFQPEGAFIQAQVPVPYGDKVIGLVVFNLPLTEVAKLENKSNRDYSVYQFVGDDWKPSQGFEESPVSPLIANVDKNQLLETRHAVVDGRLLSVKPLMENGVATGVHVISEPMAILDKVLSNSYFMIYVAQGAMSGGFILLLLQVFWRMRAHVFRPMKQLTDRLTQAAEEGGLSVRAEVIVEDEIGRMAKSFNHYVTSVQHLMISVSDMIAALSKGDLGYRIEIDAKGDLGVLKNLVNGSAANIHNVIKEIETAIYSIRDAKYDFKSSAEFHGDFKVMISDLEEAMEDTKQAIDGINDTMLAIARGDFSSRLEANLKGELDLLKSNLNASLDQLEKGVNETVDVVVAQSKGDLTKRIHGDYKGKLGEMKHAVNTSLVKVNRAVSELMVSSNTVNSASDQIAKGNSNLSDRIQDQANTLQQTVSSMEMITQMVRENATSAQDASNLATSAKQQAESGAKVIDQAMGSMKALSESSQKIADIIGLIDSIAFQTNLLALNAAVEAARAGEQGRGFAVVAGEVRSLAGKSAEAAKEIRELIETSVSQVSESEALVQKSEGEFTSIQEIILKVDEFISNIANASQQQLEGVEQINRAIEGLDGVTQQNASLVKETSAIADTLRSEAEQMREHVGFFQTSDDGQARKDSNLSKPEDD